MVAARLRRIARKATVIASTAAPSQNTDRDDQRPFEMFRSDVKCKSRLVRGDEKGELVNNRPHRNDW
jgi:hypothetical protein